MPPTTAAGNLGVKVGRRPTDIRNVVRRILDLFLVFAILIAVGFGAYELGRRVDATSNNLARSDSELNQKVYRHANPKGPSKHTIELIAISVAGAAGVMLVVSLSSSLFKTRRRQRWHAT
jgi:uncharacterized membrane protein SpoIIM required for sporulation